MKPIKLLSVMIVFLLSACTSANIRYEIRDNYTVTLRYVADIDFKMMDSELKDNITSLVKAIEDEYTRSYHFVSETIYTDERILLDLRLEVANKDLQSAFETLESLMNDPEISYLTRVDLNSKVAPYVAMLLLNFETDAQTLIDATTVDELPPMLKAEILNALKQSNATIDIVLPFSTVLSKSDAITVSHDQDTTILSINVDHDQPTQFSSDIQFSLENGKVLPMDMASSIEKSKQDIRSFETQRLMGIIAAGMSIIALFGAIFLSKNEC